MFCTISQTEGEVVHVKLVSAPPPPPPSYSLLTVPGGSFVVVLGCCFWCLGFGDVSAYVCSYFFTSVSVVEWPPFRK